MKIGEIAQKTGLAASAIRFYEEQGILQSPARGANGYRRYDDAALQRLHIIKAVQKLGFSLETIRGLFMHDGRCSKTLTLEQIDIRLEEVRRHEAVLAAQREELKGLRDMLQESLITGVDPACRSQYETQ